MPPETYTEIVHRFVVEYLEDLPAEHRAQMLINGIDPANNWQLSWSFEDLADAERVMKADALWYKNFCASRGYAEAKKYRVRDLGATQYIERSVMF